MEKCSIDQIKLAPDIYSTSQITFFFFTLIHLKHQLLSLLSKVLERAVYKSVISQSYSEQSPGLKTVHSTDTAHVAVIPMRQASRSVELRTYHHPDPS